MNALTTARELRPDERRRWPRVSLGAEAILRFDAPDARMRSRILNASHKGVLLAVPAARPVGTRMGITVFFTQPGTEIRVEGVVVHATQRNHLYEDELPFQLGIFLTVAGDDWRALCDALSA